MRSIVVLLLTVLAGPTPADAIELDFEYFRSEVQPIFLAKRPGNMRCIDCHAGKAFSGFNIEPLPPGTYYWDEAASRKNFSAASAFVMPGKPLESRLLAHALVASAGGDPFHGGGKHFSGQDDPEWRILRDWALGSRERAAPAELVVRVIQTNAAGDDSHVIDPATNEVVGVIHDVEIPHGVAGAPDGRYVYITNEKRHTLDVIDARTLRVHRRIPLSGKPNNVSVSHDGSKVYVGIMEMPGGVDVIDAGRFVNAKTIPVEGAIHNIYVTPDGRHAVAGSIHTSTINVIDTAKDELAWTLELSAGIRPMAFDTNPDGTTRHIYVQLSFFHGFAVVDFESRREIARFEHPPVEGVHPHHDGLQMAPAHGLGVSPDGKTVWSTSKVYGYAYIYSIPDFEEVGRVFVGQHPEWITFTPDGRFAYVGAAGDNATYVIDTKTLEEVARVPVGQVPKRVAMVRMAVDD